MKLTNNILHALRGRKRDVEESRLKSLLAAALPKEDNKLKTAELKLKDFKKELIALNNEKTRLDAAMVSYSAKREKLQEQIKNKLGHDFYYDMGRGIERGYGYRDPGRQANSNLANIIDSALVDLQLECIGLKDEALRAAIARFNDTPLAEGAVKMTVTWLNSKDAAE
jgi:hypothetical protein